MEKVKNLQEAFPHVISSNHDEIMNINEAAVNEYFNETNSSAKEEFEKSFEKESDKILSLVHEIQLLGITKKQSTGTFYAAMRILFNTHSAEVEMRLGLEEFADFNNFIDSTFTKIETNKELERRVNLNA